MVDKKLCFAAGCFRPLPKGHSKYCSKKCSNRIRTQKYRAKKDGVVLNQ